MLFKFKSVQNKQIRRFLEHGIYLAMILILIPTFLLFELCIVLPAVEEQWSVPFFVHIVCASFLLSNIVGNIIYGMFTNTSIIGKNFSDFNKKNWTICTECECLRPPRAWHCNICDVCILKRDHHCTFLVNCVGYYNARYFILFTLHMFIATIYSLYFNIKFLSMVIAWNHGLVLIKFLLPLVAIVLDFNAETVYVCFIMINVIVLIFSGILFFFHLNNILRGRVTPERSTYTKGFIYNRGWKLNLIEVFGVRWYLTWISPFIHSQLPGNGIEWHINNKKE